ncbi:MAG: tyrosine-protein phosphatase [Eggerthellaceae bacterium]|nr:tyrosine-protein phosphatase [Eggerthellaceae bacterium]
MKKASIIISVVALVLVIGGALLIALDSSERNVKALEDCPVIHELEFGGVYIDITIDEFNALGYEYGDSVSVRFSNGYTLEDLPYYNGYYTANGEELLVAYPGYPHIRVGINNGDDLWVIAGLSEGMTASVSLYEAGKYINIQEVRNLQYKDDRSLFPGDEVFANFREVTIGNLKDNVFYRSASPCDNQHNRAPYVDALIEQAQVAFIVDLADDDAKIQGYMDKEGFSSNYFKGLYQAGKVIALALNMNYGSDDFKTKVGNGLAAMASNDGPYLVHCTEGKDRTGFVCVLIEAFAGATYEEIKDDYMVTYFNYYGITEAKDKVKYDTIVESLLDPMIVSIVGNASVDYKTADLSSYARAFIASAGLSDTQIAQLRSKLLK